MEFHVLTIFPEMLDSPFRWGVVARALETGRIRILVHDIRAYAPDAHRTMDDYPYGGGEGMVMKPEPLFAAVDDLKSQGVRGPVILLSPQGEVLKQSLARELACLDGMILLCGRYEGVDERVITGCVEREISIGDYILTGGELAAMVLIDTVARLKEGVLGNKDSMQKESFETGLLKCPQYTRPPVFRGMKVPSVLFSGNHAEIAQWRRKQALRRTLIRRPDLLIDVDLTSEEMRFLEEIREGSTQAEDA